MDFQHNLTLAVIVPKRVWIDFATFDIYNNKCPIFTTTLKYFFYNLFVNLSLGCSFRSQSFNYFKCSGCVIGIIDILK